MAKLIVVIPAAGLGRRMRSYGPKALIKIAGGETVVARQIRLTRLAFPGAEIIVVTGFESDRLRRALPRDVRVVVNASYDETNVAHSLLLGIQHARPTASVLVVYGDLVFNTRAIEGLDKSTSSLIIDARPGSREDEVGVNVVDDEVMCLAYGLPAKWAQIALLRPREAALFREVAREPRRKRQFGFEILNEILDRGGTFAAHVPDGLSLVEIDSSKDIEPALLIH